MLGAVGKEARTGGGGSVVCSPSRSLSPNIRGVVLVPLWKLSRGHLSLINGVLVALMEFCKLNDTPHTLSLSSKQIFSLGSSP